MNTTRLRVRVLLTGAALPALALTAVGFGAAPASAQAVDCPDENFNGVCDGEELLLNTTDDYRPVVDAIVVTGSRIARPDLASAIPVQSILAEQITSTGDLSLGDAINELPSLRSTFSQANSTRFIGTAGLNLLDLRGLGSARTLVLVNGLRHVSATPGEFRVDVNTIPSSLLERVDIVTGGNSAVYGSDAVSGVVNFVLRRDYEGAELRGQAGLSDEGDRGSYQLSALVGQNFLDNRLNVTFHGEYSRQKPVYYRDRPNFTGAYTGTPGFYTVENTLGEPPEGDGIPDTAFFDTTPGSTFNIISEGGAVLTSCPAEPAATDPNFALIQARRAAVCTGQTSPTGGRLSDNYFFLPNGTLVRNNPEIDLRNVGGGTFGGLGSTGVEDDILIPGIERYIGNILINFAISPAFEPFIEAKYARVTANQASNQPTFVNSTLSPRFFLDNPFLSDQARTTIQTITGTTSTTAPFTFFRFNNDIGTRTEDHLRETYRVVGGIRGDIFLTGNVRYEVAVNWGRTETFYETGGNVDIAKFNAAADARRAPNGTIQCRINVDTNTANDDPACVPLNLFGFQSPSLAARDYILYTSTRDEWAEQLQIAAFVAGDSSGLFELPGGPLGFALGAEYRTEDAFSDYDDFTQSGATFLNSFDTFDPPKVEVKEAFAELRVPILGDLPFINELTVEASGRVSDYDFLDDVVYAYNVGGIWSPVDGLRLRVGYGRSVRAPNLTDLFATRSETFANNLRDPCDQRFIDENPNRARNCAEDGIPTTIVLPGETTSRPWTNQPASGISGFNQGNENLVPEVGNSFTAGAVFQPRAIPGLAVTVDYYDIEITTAISGLTGQNIINRCYDDPVSIDNPFCDAVFRRSTDDPITNGAFDGQAGRRFDGFPDFSFPVLGPGFLNQPFNFQALKTKGVDLNASYRRFLGETEFSTNLLLSYLIEREEFTFITDPDRSTRLHGVLGDPQWTGIFQADADFGFLDVSYDLRYVGKQTIDSWETRFSHQGRPPENADRRPFGFYPEKFYHDIQFGFELEDLHRFYIGVDNVLDTLPPLGLMGDGDGSAIFPNTGRFYYAGFRVRFGS